MKSPDRQHLFSYTVICTFSDEHVAEEWIVWLRDEHLKEVLAAGALDAEVIRLDGSPPGNPAIVRCEVRYHFASREAFAVYEREHAPLLRAAGLKRFPPERGLNYERTAGEVVVGAYAR